MIMTCIQINYQLFFVCSPFLLVWNDNNNKEIIYHRGGLLSPEDTFG